MAAILDLAPHPNAARLPLSQYTQTTCDENEVIGTRVALKAIQVVAPCHLCIDSF
ncbi:hypothetical protein SH528x_004776 [Novipirellula sp. SH528]|uniref:hypothetical protein n=1 Tax=Novipirellula sp. SH528 TaxID=3454466 RepID=UPI003FA10D65